MKWALKKSKSGKGEPSAPKVKLSKPPRKWFVRKPKPQQAAPEITVEEKAEKQRKIWSFKRKAKEGKEPSVPKEKLPKGKKSAAVKSVVLSAKKPSFGRKARFTLLIGDEGAILVHMKGSKVISRQFVPDASPPNLAELRATIEKDDLAPITMIIDSVDQVFVQQTLPPVSSMSVQKLINRRLERDFKPEDIKGALVLGKEKSGRKDWNFLMVSVEKSPQIMLWLDFVMGFNNRFRGIVLLSVEAEMFIKHLERAMGVATKPGTGVEWKILVSHNKVGGFRQIILRNGRLIFTRLAMPVGEPVPEVIAGNIEQEMLSTIEYLKRFGYNPRTGLNVYVLASEEVCARIEPRRFEASSFYALSPYKIAEYLGIEGATQPTDQFGDVVLAAAVGSIKKNILKLTTIESRLFDKFQLFKLGQRLVVTFAVLGMIVYAAYLGYETLLAASEIADLKQKQSIHQQGLETVKKQIADSKMDVDVVTDQFELYQQIKNEVRSPLSFFALLQGLVKSPVELKTISWKMGGTTPLTGTIPSLLSFPLPPDPAAPPSPPPAVPANSADMVTVVLTLEFPVGLKSVPLFKKFADDFLMQLYAAMPDYTLAYTKVPPEYEPKEGLQLNFEDKAAVQGTLGQSPVNVEVTIRGNIPSLAEESGAP